jgi:hypothetical protein
MRIFRDGDGCTIAQLDQWKRGSAIYPVWELDATWDLYGTPLQLGRSEGNLMTEYVTANISVSVVSSSDLVSTPIIAVPSDFLETPAK